MTKLVLGAVAAVGLGGAAVSLYLVSTASLAGGVSLLLSGGLTPV
jgi:hypothetical protein